MDGKKSLQVDGLSKLTKIEELRNKLENAFNVPPIMQRLFFRGKQVSLVTCRNHKSVLLSLLRSQI